MKAPSETESQLQGKAGVEDRWSSLASLPCLLTLELAVPHVTIGNLFDLDVGSVINSLHSTTSPVPIWVNGVKLGWGELDVAGKHLALRITEMY
jgi:flagellar motor switch/type III secretory pathway protein FliN